MSREVCFQESEIKLYLFIFMVMIVYLLYIYFNNPKTDHMSNVDLNTGLTKDQLNEKLQKLQNELYETQVSEQKCQIELNSIKEVSPQLQKYTDLNLREKLLNKIYNPLVSPDRIYPGGRFNMDSYSNYQLVGFIYNNEEERFPLYGRPKYPGKTDKYEYYIIDESRNKLKIPFKTRNDNELNSGDTIDINGVGTGFNVTIYEYDTLRYNPNIF